MQTHITIAIALAVLVAGYFTRPHGFLGQAGMLLAGMAIIGAAVIEAVRLYKASKDKK